MVIHNLYGWFRTHLGPYYFGLPRISKLALGLVLLFTTLVERYKTKLFGIG
jgi:hypothetical protein